MKIVITGGMGCGKSHVSAVLIRDYLPTYELYDYDKVVHQLYTDPSIQSVLYLTFGTVDRREISKHVFRNKKSLNELKKIFSEPLKKSIASINESSNIILDIPIWHEYRREFDIKPDFVICVSCNDDEQIRRIKNRDGRTDVEIERILSNQMSQEAKKHLSDFIIYTDDTADLDAQIRKILLVGKITIDNQLSSPQIS